MTRVAGTGVGVRIFIIDACRDNPFAARGVRSVGATRGLNIKEQAPDNTFVLYSAGIGQQALDRLNETDADPTSVYTRTLLRRLASDNSILGIAKDVQREVRDIARRIGHTQQPAFYDEFIGSERFYVDPLKDPLRGWAPICAEPASPTTNVWNHNTSQVFMVADGNRRRLHYIEPRKAVKDQGVKPNCLLIDGEVTAGRFVGKARIFRERCGEYAYDVVGDYSDDLQRFELKGPSPVPLENCRVSRLEPNSGNALLVFARPPPPVAPVQPVVQAPAVPPAPEPPQQAPAAAVPPAATATPAPPKQ